MTAELAPKFAVVMRGYDRAQVDAYIDSLAGRPVDGATGVQEASGEVARLREQAETLRTRVAQLEQEATAEPPRSLRALGERVSVLLRLAEQGSRAVCADAEEVAEATVVRARLEAEEVSRAVRAQQASAEATMAEAMARAGAAVEAAEARTAELAARLLADAERRASARQAEAEVRALAIVKEAETRADTTIDQAEAVALNSVDQAEAERGRILADLADQRTQIASELQRLASERSGVLDDLDKLREALHRTITEVLVAPLPLDPP